MAWTAKIERKTWDNGTLFVDFLFTDGVRISKRHHKVGGVVPDEWLEKTAQAEIIALNAVDAIKDVIVIDQAITKPSPVSDESLFMLDLKKMYRVNQLITVGALTKSDPRVMELASSIASNLNKYWDLV